MGSVREEGRQVNGKGILAEAMKAGQAALLAAASGHINRRLSEVATAVVGRDFHVRRDKWAGEGEIDGQCQRCHTRDNWRFSRNGYRGRSLLTVLGWLSLWLPRLRCECGGSVAINLEGLMRPYQRISDEVTEQIQRWYRLGMSLRHMAEALEASWIGPLSLRTLLLRVQQMTEQVSEPWPSAAPPIIELDAIWVTMLLPSGDVYRDRKGRRRPRVGRFKRPILVALGIWPQAERSVILDWMVADSEDEGQWSLFLSRLEEQGIQVEKGLQLLIHDGGSGLCAALHLVHFGAPTQRCLFHKLRNIAQAIALPKGLTRTQRSRQRKAILKPFREIWQAKRYTTALQRYLQVVRHFRTSQPDAVAALRRDFRHTVAFYSLSATYETHFLRTTSHLERFNRTLRTQFNKATAYHSTQGLLAVISQQTTLFNA